MSSELLARIFCVLDTSSSNKLSFEEFAEGICLFISGSRKAQAVVLFNLMDVSGDRVVDKLELLRFFVGGLKATRAERRIVSQMVNEIMELVDEDNSGEISMEEFVNTVGNDEEVCTKPSCLKSSELWCLCVFRFGSCLEKYRQSHN